MKNEAFHKAKDYFELAEETAKVLKNYQNANWVRAHVYECEYYEAKYERDLGRIIRLLKKIVKHYAKTQDRTAFFVNKGDLAKYRGLRLKIEKRFSDAAQCFVDSVSWHRKALASDPRYSDKHRLSVQYSSALAVGTAADIDLLARNDFSDASIKYDEASQKFAYCGDMKSASIYMNLAQLSRSLANDNFKAALSVMGKLSSDFRLPSKSMSLKEFLSYTGLMISSYAAKMVKEIVEIDKGPSFEARVRELIKSFDNREVDGREIQALPHSIRKLKLTRYNKVERRIFKPRNDEIGIVFEDDAPVEIDVLAERMEGNRRFLLLAECKHSPDKVFRTRELALLKRKTEFVEARYKKLADLCEEHQPIIEQEWFVTTGRFYDDAIEFARINKIILIGIDALNNLLKCFQSPRIRNMRARIQ